MNTYSNQRKSRCEIRDWRYASAGIFLSLVFILCDGQAAVTSADVAFPKDNYVPGWVKSERLLHFEKSNLFDYIDGGAELFLEFGFDGLLVQRYTKYYPGGAGRGEDTTRTQFAEPAGGGDEIAIEVYRMESSEAALGIYLSKCGKETPIKGITARNTGDRYQFTILKGDCFIQVNSFSGDERLMRVMTALADKVLRSIPKGHTVRLLDRLPKKGLLRGSGLLVRGPYSLQSIFTFGRGDVLQLGGRVFGVTGDYIGENGDTYTRILISYPDTKAALSAFDNLLNNLDPYLEIKHRWEKGFSFKDYRAKFGIVKLQDDVMEIEINLPEEQVSE